MFLRTTHNMTDPVCTLCAIYCAHPEDDSGSIDISLHDKGGGCSHFDHSDTGGEALSRRTSTKQLLGVDCVHKNRNTSRQRYMPSVLETILNPSGIR